jgi:hypothetical protein
MRNVKQIPLPAGPLPTGRQAVPTARAGPGRAGQAGMIQISNFEKKLF